MRAEGRAGPSSRPEGQKAKSTLPTFSLVSAQPGLERFPGCMEPCSCPSDDFNPVCEPSSRVEYLTPCHAGCTSRMVQDALGKSQVGEASGFLLCLSLLCPSLSQCLCLSPSPPLNVLTVWLCSVSFCWQM